MTVRGRDRHHRRAALAGLAALAAMLPASTAPVQAQGIGLPGQNRKLPIEIHADKGIEWQQNSQAYVARGNARAVQGKVTLRADTLIAYYKKGPDGGTQIWRMDAIGNVRIKSPQQTAYGANAVYGVENGVLILTGKPLMVTETDRITARERIEYWEKRSIAVARGNAIATRGDKRLRADILTAHFVAGKDGKSTLRRIDALDNVLISSPTEIVRGDKGIYNLQTGIARIYGSVKITRGRDQLNGDAAEVNLNTGISKLLAGTGGRVRGTFVPSQGKTDAGPGTKQ